MKIKHAGLRKSAAWASTVAIALAAAGCSAEGASGDTTTLTFASMYPEDNPYQDAAEDWMDEITKQTDGAVKFKVYPSGSLCGAADITQCVSDGRADVGLTAPSYTPDKFPLLGICTVPFQSTSAQANVDVLNTMATEGQLAAEFEAAGHHPIYVDPVGAPMLASSEEVTSDGDLDGLKVRATGLVLGAIQELGATPVATSPDEMYEAMDRGVIQGVVSVLDAQMTWRINEVADHFYDLTAFAGAFNCVQNTMNLKTWNKLSTETQEVIDSVSADVGSRIFADYVRPADVDYCATLVDEVDSVEPFPVNDETQALAERLKVDLVDQFVDEANSAGADDARGFADEYFAALAEENAANPAPDSDAAICATDN